ncbi:nuclear transport factor 2 family protein [Microbispora sp. H13382]|uniref:nuclear transport factor 2 family protein n=1 Tax=Microbispora sp. H13382 TaxID=2729112 RepID=UPI0016002C68|nr:nuclear transport factor 2 family protein [Microbispora sp. H13382]
MTSVSTEDRLAVMALLAEHAYRNDHGLTDTLWELYGEKCRSEGPMGTMVGRDAIRQWGIRRLGNPSKVRHVLSNIRVFWSEGRLCATSYYVAFRDTHANAATPASVGEYHDTFEKVGDEWLLAERRVVPVFTNADAPRPVVASPVDASPVVAGTEDEGR